MNTCNFLYTLLPTTVRLLLTSGASVNLPLVVPMSSLEFIVGAWQLRGGCCDENWSLICKYANGTVVASLGSANERYVRV